MNNFTLSQKREEYIMQAVIKTGGKQYSVNKGDVIDVELLTGNPGDVVEFKEVLLVADEGGTTIGSPVVDNAVVKAKILGTKKGEKLIVFKFRRRKDFRKKTGHRQKFTSVEITEISR
jgi:large subunit ribosomal protein L21